MGNAPADLISAELEGPECSELVLRLGSMRSSHCKYSLVKINAGFCVNTIT